MSINNSKPIIYIEDYLAQTATNPHYLYIGVFIVFVLALVFFITYLSFKVNSKTPCKNKLDFKDQKDNLKDI